MSEKPVSDSLTSREKESGKYWDLTQMRSSGVCRIRLFEML